ncbi:MAG: cyclic pyranopterin monophosphate synthase accessory protein [Bacteroidota bacterium]|nr:MAG: cyclic pyranopterin monophosphate synthase accessory protein [Bacteroidota bacterium]
MKKQFTHIDASGNPKMVDVSEKRVTKRVAKAQAVVLLGKEIVSQIKNNELITKKGPVFHTAIVAGVMAAKKTHELIPFCHPLALEDCQVQITVDGKQVVITTEARLEGKTGVEMEALTAATVAALTVYDMCKALSHNILIKEVKLMAKSGGKKDFLRKT